MGEESMVERVARVLWAYRHPGARWEEVGDSGQDSYRYEGAAIIAAMREPTAAMRDAGAESLYGHPRHKAEEWAKIDKYEGDGQTAVEAYKAMIDAAGAVLSAEESP